MATKDQQDMGSDPSGRVKSGGFGTKDDPLRTQRGGEHGEKRATNADHDQKIAENRRQILKPPPADDDVLGQTSDRRSNDPDRERPAGDIVSGRTEHSEFPGTQAGYDRRPENNRPPQERNDDLSALDRGRNDDLSALDGKGDDGPLK
jgi:hypothetical protein